MGIGPVTFAAVTAATTAGQISSSSQLAHKIMFQADPANSGKIYIGDANVSVTRYMVALTAGDRQLFSIESSNMPGNSNFQLNSFYAIGSAASQIIHMSYFERLGSL